MARSLTVISLLFQSTTHCRYRVYTKFLLTYTAIYRRNSKVLPLGITALQPQSHFHLGTPYMFFYKGVSRIKGRAFKKCSVRTFMTLFTKYIYCWGDEMKEDEMGGSHATYETEDRCIHGSGSKNGGKEIISKIHV